MFAFAPYGCGSTICAVASRRESVGSGCPAALCGPFPLPTPSEGVRGGCACIGDATRAHYTGTEPGRQWLTHAVNELGLGTGRGHSTPPGRLLIDIGFIQSVQHHLVKYQIPPLFHLPIR